MHTTMQQTAATTFTFILSCDTRQTETLSDFLLILFSLFISLSVFLSLYFYSNQHTHTHTHTFSLPLSFNSSMALYSLLSFFSLSLLLSPSLSCHFTENGALMCTWLY